MVAEDAVEEEPCQPWCIEGLVARDEVGIAGETVADDPDGVVAVRERELDDVVHGDGAPWTERSSEGLEKAERLVAWSLDATTSVTGTHIVADIRGDAWPRVIARDESEGASATRMARDGGVMAKVEDARAHREWDEEAAEVEDKVVFDLEVFAATSECISPLRVSGKSSLVSLEELGVVDQEGGDCCNFDGLERWSRRSACWLCEKALCVKRSQQNTVVFVEDGIPLSRREVGTPRGASAGFLRPGA